MVKRVGWLWCLLVLVLSSVCSAQAPDESTVDLSDIEAELASMQEQILLDSMVDSCAPPRTRAEIEARLGELTVLIYFKMLDCGNAWTLMQNTAQRRDVLRVALMVLESDPDATAEQRRAMQLQVNDAIRVAYRAAGYYSLQSNQQQILILEFDAMQAQLSRM